MSTADGVPRPYICYRCDCVVSLTSPPDSNLRCPSCNGNPVHLFPIPDDSALYLSSNGDPVPVHLFHLLDDSAFTPSSSASVDQGSSVSFAAHFHKGGASREAVEGLPCVKITEELIDRSDSDSGVQCAVCMSEFELGSEARQMPCKHMFHSDCILPWLELHNSCPVCRYELPTDRNGNSSSSSLDWDGGGLDGGSETPERFRICLPWLSNYCFLCCFWGCFWCHLWWS